MLLFVAAVSASMLFVGVTESGLYAQAVESESERNVATIDADIAIVNHPEAETTYDEAIATVDPETGTTDSSGTDATALYLHETGETTVTLDVGWDSDTIDIVVEE